MLSSCLPCMGPDLQWKSVGGKWGGGGGDSVGRPLLLHPVQFNQGSLLLGGELQSLGGHVLDVLHLLRYDPLRSGTMRQGIGMGGRKRSIQGHLVVRGMVLSPTTHPHHHHHHALGGCAPIFPCLTCHPLRERDCQDKRTRLVDMCGALFGGK